MGEGLLDAIDERAKPKAPTLKLDLILESLDEETRAGLLERLARPDVGHTVIAEVLTDNGYPIDECAVRRWRNRQNK